jgi:hypothetical protein
MPTPAAFPLLMIVVAIAVGQNGDPASHRQRARRGGGEA